MLYPPPPPPPPPLYRTITKNIIGCKAVSDMALDPLRFARQDMVGELNLGCHRRDKVVDRRPQQGEGSKSLARAGISIPLFRFIFGQ
jgi:hypothetical protein